MQVKHTFLIVFVSSLVWVGVLFAHSAAPQPGVNNIFTANPDGPNASCFCHGSASTPPPTWISGLPALWVPNTDYHITVTVPAGSSTNRYGFELSAVFNNTLNQAGTISIDAGGAPAQTIVGTGTLAGVTFAVHNGKSDDNTYKVLWHSPANMADVRFDVGAVRADNNNMSSGDVSFGRSLVISATETSPPTVTITTPTSNTIHTTRFDTITLGGTASDNVGVTQVTWESNRGPFGNCSGTTNWTCNGVFLQAGANVLTVKASDAAGNIGQDILTVTLDATLPTVTITSPTSNTTFSTRFNPITLGGTGSDNLGVTQVVWMNDRGGSDACTGTANWTCSNINLQPGVNNLTIRATDTAGNVGQDILTVTLDTTPPTVTITSPTSNPTFGTGTSPITLVGTASDSVGVTSVTWANDRGGNGACTGTTAWTCSNIPLLSGQNVLTISASDAATNAGTDTLTVTLTLGTPIPNLSLSNIGFGSELVGVTSLSRSVTLVNNGTALLTISSITASGDFARTHNCAATLPAGQSCLINVTFSPTALGARTGSLTIASNGFGSPNIVPLNGTGGARAPRDFNGDTRSDILWRDTAGNVTMWQMNGAIADSFFIANIWTGWTIAGAGDFNGDRKADVLWRSVGGDVAIWLLNGTSIISSPIIANIWIDWKIVGTGDFNGDGKSDILWRDSGGNVAMWLMDGTSILSSLIITNIWIDWKIVGTGDFNGDGKSDILWRDSGGNVAMWLMNGTTIISRPIIANVFPTWNIVGVGDFNGDGKSDILWHSTGGDVAIWLMNGTSMISSTSVANVAISWSIVGTGDYDGNGNTDILWRDTSGSVSIWFMNGPAIASTAGLPNVSDGLAQ